MNNLKCSLETRVSKKGNTYQVLVIKLTDTYERLVFLDKAEIALLNSLDQKKSTDLFK